MDRLKGLPAFAAIAIIVLAALRVVHVAVPAVFPETRQGPIAIANLDDVRRRVGFAPLLPGYRPESLGAEPVSMQVTLGSWPAFTIVWSKEDQYLSVTQRKGGPEPAYPPIGRPLTGIDQSTWWSAGSRHHLILQRAGFWIEIETSLPERDLRRFADTLAAY
jgi:hypothetical protein